MRRMTKLSQILLCLNVVSQSLKTVYDTVYLSTLTKNYLKSINIYDVARSCTDLKSMFCQQHEVCGFIPLNNLRYEWAKGLPPNVCSKEFCQDPINLHYQVAKKYLPNFLGARIQVNFNFNHDLYDTLLQGYWDWQMFLRYGFGSSLCLRVSQTRRRVFARRVQYGCHIWPPL